MTGVLRFTLAQAKRVLLVQALEETGALSKDVAQKASLKAAHCLGTSSDIRRFLIERSDNVLGSVNTEKKLLESHNDFQNAAIFSLLFFLFAFGLGILSDRLTSAEHIINLFSLSFFGLILWNLAAYSLVILVSCGLINSSWLPIRQTLLQLIKELSFRTLKKHSVRSHYFTSLCDVLRPAVVRYTVRNLHIAAALFALGLIVSLLLRGLSTNYWATWESTWYFYDFEAVKWFLDHTYGLIPAVFGIEAMPSVEGVAAMRSDNLIYMKSGVSAAPWVIRASLLLVFFVIIPRAILAIAEHLRLKRALATVDIQDNSEYFKSVLLEGNLSAQSGDLFFITDTVLHEENETLLKKYASAWGNLSTDYIFKTDLTADLIDFPMPGNRLPIKADDQHTHLLCLVTDAVTTPEDDLHGRAVDMMKAAYSRSPLLVTALVLDARTLENRLKDYPERINERLALWTAFASDHHCQIFIERNQQSALPSIRFYFNEQALLARNLEKSL